MTAGFARTMQSLTGGRFTLGLGRGVTAMQDAYGIPRITTREIEDFLYRHPDIQDVQVIGVPDPTYGEELMACIILRPGAQPLTAEDVAEDCKGELAHYKGPRYVDIRDSFPMTVSGKVRKVQMREEAVARLGLGEASPA